MEVINKDERKSDTMKLEPIVNSLLDTDLYKLTMQQVMFHKHPDLTGTYIFKCRNKDVKFTYEMLDEINAQIDHLCTLSYTNDEIEYLHSIRFLKSYFKTSNASGSKP